MTENTTKTLKSQHQNPPKTPFIYDNLSQQKLIKCVVEVNFPGWRKPHHSWANWVEKLSIKYAKIWESTGICDGILSSLHEIKSNPKIILGLSEFWCSKTNTFVFPWGEATITLEDVYFLSGLPVIGETVKLLLFDDFSKNLEHKLHQVKNALSITTCETNSWINYFSKEKHDVEHIGFLAFWLSMFVFPDLEETRVGKDGFSVAVHLAKGVRIALAPAVLACLYQNLTYLTQHAADFHCAKKVVSVSGPFQILQVWALERFPLLGLKLAKPLSIGRPRIARWDMVSVKMSLADVRKVLRSSGDSFCSRPYASVLKNWRHRSFYVDGEKLLSDSPDDFDEELKSFRVFLQPGELIGIDCVEIYLPQRVLMQFKCDQKVLGETAVSGISESDITSLLQVEKSYDQKDNKLSKSLSAHSNAIDEALEQEGNDHDHEKPQSNTIDVGLEQQEGSDDHKKPMLVSEITRLLSNCDEDSDLSKVAADNSRKNEILNASGDEKGMKQNSRINEERYLEGLVSNVDTHKRPVITSDSTKPEMNCDSATQSEILNVMGHDNGMKNTIHGKDEDQSFEGLVVLDSEDEIATNLGRKDVIQSKRRTKKLRRIGDSADYPFCIQDCSNKIVRTEKKSGISFGNPVNVEDYWF